MANETDFRRVLDRLEEESRERGLSRMRKARESMDNMGVEFDQSTSEKVRVIVKNSTR